MSLQGHFILLICLTFLVNANTEEWNKHCPAACTCHDSHFSELSLYRWLQEEPSNVQIPSHYHNNVMYEDEPPPIDMNIVLRMAMCVFQLGTQPDMLLSELSPDIQALTILQGRDSGEIMLEAEHLAHFQELQVLEIHGFYHDAHNHSSNELPSTNNEHAKLVLKSDALHPLASLKYLNLQHIKLLGNPAQGNRASPAIEPLDPISNDISVNLAMQYSTRKTKTLHRLVFLPPADGDGDILPYKVYIEQQEKAALSTFTGLTNLMFIRVFRCGMREINWEMFDGLYNLNYLSLEGNHLLFIPDFAFLGAPNLRTLSLAHNQLLSLQSTSLAGLFELEKLDLSYNNFSHLSELSLPPFPKLRTADFTHNPIESVFASTFEIMNATSTLLIGGEDSALTIQPNSFLGLVNLRKLSIINVGIALLERELLRGMPKLKELELSGIIESITFDAFLEIPKLENLKLSNCGINSISMDAFYGLYGLLYLDLSNNLLEALSPGMFDQQFSLRELHLNKNKLVRLPPGFLANVPAKMVRLDDNPWHCTCAMKDWQPAIINKVKQKGSRVFCQFYYDKGSMCNQTVSADRYLYDKRVAPKCSSPPKYKNWGVFQVLRKELKCNSKQHIKMDRKAYLKRKYEDYEKSIKPTYIGNKPTFKYYPQKPIKPSSNITISNTTKSRIATNLLNASLEQTIKFLKPTSTPPEHTTKFLQPTSTLSQHHTKFLQPTSTSLEHTTKFIQLTSTPLVQTTKTFNLTSIPTEQNPITHKMQNITMESITSIFTPNHFITSATTQSFTEKNHYKQDITDVTTNPKEEMNTVTSTSTMNTVNMKEEEQKTDLLSERATMKEKLLKPHASNSITEQEIPIKISKKAWKMEMERKRQEKLKRYQSLNEQNNISNTI